jgi:hypothetical protein
MERCVSVSRLRLNTVILLLFLGVQVPVVADHRMVLVTRADSPIKSISTLDLRKLYLGFSVTSSSGQVIEPLFNRTHPHLPELFVQDVMGMSSRSYDRRLLGTTLQTGRRRPQSFDDLDALFERLDANEYAVTFAWSEDVAGRDDIRVLRVLWHR